jgi:hypothetical protein
MKLSKIGLAGFVGFALFCDVIAVLAQPAPQGPPLAACGSAPGMEIICGVEAPEDLERTPDDRYLIVSQYASFRTPGKTSELMLMNVKTHELAKLAVTVAPLKGWGDPACPAPAQFMPHGTSLGQRTNGTYQLYVVNHGGRQSVEMYELKRAGTSWSAAWHGCVISEKEFNDVAALPDGSFVGTHPSGLVQPGQQRGADPFSGPPTGYVAHWSEAKGEVELKGTHLLYPNGVNAAPDGKTLYINGFGSRDVSRYDMRSDKITAVAKLDFMPDNLTWTKFNKLIAAGVKGARGECPPASGTPCIMAFGVARITPATMQAQPVFDSKDKALISGVSVAAEVGADLYIGAFQGDRLVRMPLKGLGK